MTTSGVIYAILASFVTQSLDLLTYHGVSYLRHVNVVIVYDMLMSHRITESGLAVAIVSFFDEFHRRVTGLKTPPGVTSLIKLTLIELTIFEGGLNLLDKADDDAVVWLESTATAALAK